VITGFNTDIDHDERVFHVQTEDKGLNNPVVESLIYCGGEIVTSRSSSYTDLVEGGGAGEDEILRRMEAQHQALIRDIFNGRFDAEGPKPFGHSVMTNRSLDEVVTEYLKENFQVEPIELQLVDEQLLLTEGTRPTLRMKVLEQNSARPVARAHVSVQLISTMDDPRELFSSSTDQEGFIEASFDLPVMPGADAAVVCVAEVAGEKSELRQLVSKGRPR